jgi:uncharacterized protein YutE (UPF0331/DUF86 family)
MVKVNRERIRFLLGEMGRAVAQVSTHLAAEDDRLLADLVGLGSVKYNLIVAIQAMIDVCNHIVTRRGGAAPQDYADCFVSLGRVAGWSDEDVGRFQSMARFRNLLVHLYWQVDDRRVVATCRAHLDDFHRYQELIAQLLAGES